MDELQGGVGGVCMCVSVKVSIHPILASSDETMIDAEINMQVVNRVDLFV